MVDFSRDMDLILALLLKDKLSPWVAESNELSGEALGVVPNLIETELNLVLDCKSVTLRSSTFVDLSDGLYVLCKDVLKIFLFLVFVTSVRPVVCAIVDTVVLVSLELVPGFSLLAGVKDFVEVIY